MNILFVCTGNTCRSPMAEALFRYHAEERHAAQSAGIFATEGIPVNDYASRALQGQGVEVPQPSKPITNDLLTWADLVLVMTESHLQLMNEQYQEAVGKTYLLKEYTAEHNGAESAGSEPVDIADPFGQDFSVYQNTLSELDIYIARLLQMIETGE